MLQLAAKIIEQRTGLSSRHADLEAIAAGDAVGFLQRLRDESLSSPTWQAVIRTLAIGETYFFRDESQFRILRQHILPHLILQHRQRQDLTLTLWSVGCATGEEPYSLAILLHELIPDIARWTITLLGTDINQQALAAARLGIYRPWSFRQPTPTLDHYFDVVTDGRQLQPTLREQVRFLQHNLLDGAPLPQVDLIFCRNVMLYFSPEQSVCAEAVLRDALVPEGWLFLGHSETLRHSQWIANQFPGVPIYQKPRQTGQLQPPPAPPLASPHATHPATPPDDLHYAEALNAYQQQQPERAEQLLRALLTKSPSYPRAWALLACIDADRQQRQDAHKHLDHALRHDPMFADAHYLRAVLHTESGQATAAQQALRAALYCQRNHPLAGYMLASWAANAGDFSRANKLWEIVRQAIIDLPPTHRLSDFSEMTAGQLLSLIVEQL